jgi:hypothetical protein
MYIMVKTYQNLEFLAQVSSPELSILENRKHNQAGTMRSAEDYTHSSVPKRIGLCRKAGSSKRGLRKSSSLTNGISLLETKVGLKSMALRPEVLSVTNLSICQCVHPGQPR